MFVVRLISICWRMRTKRAMNSGVLRNTRIILFFFLPTIFYFQVIIRSYRTAIQCSSYSQMILVSVLELVTKLKLHLLLKTLMKFSTQKDLTPWTVHSPRSAIWQKCPRLNWLQDPSHKQVSFFIPLQFLQFFLRNWPRIESSRRWTK